MRLPLKIEMELQAIERWMAQLPSQYAGTPRLIGLRFAIEDFMEANKLKWNSPDVDRNE